MWVFDLVHHRHVLQLYVQELVYALQRTAYRNVVLKLDGDLGVNEGFEEAVKARISLRLAPLNFVARGWVMKDAEQS